MVAAHDEHDHIHKPPDAHKATSDELHDAQEPIPGVEAVNAEAPESCGENEGCVVAALALHKSPRVRSSCGYSLALLGRFVKLVFSLDKALMMAYNT